MVVENLLDRTIQMVPWWHMRQDNVPVSLIKRIFEVILFYLLVY